MKLVSDKKKCLFFNKTISGHQCQLSDMNFPGSDLNKIKDITSWADCGELCYNNPDCKSFSWVGPESWLLDLIQDCFLKNAVPSQSPLTGVYSGVSDCLTQKPPSEAYLFQDSKGDFFGG